MPIDAGKPSAHSAAAIARVQGQTRNSPATANPWQDPSSNLRKRALTNVTQNSLKVPRTGTQHANQSPGPSNLSKMNIGDSSNPTLPPKPPPATQPVWNPSSAPAPSNNGYNLRPLGTTSSFASYRSGRQGIRNTVCTIGRYRQADFRLGDILSLPYHESNTNPHTTPGDKHLANTWIGPVYSKRRMVIVLWMHTRDMFCLPLYTFDHTGLRNKQHLLHEYVSVQNYGDEKFQNQGMYPPVVADTTYPLDDDTTVHITGGLKVACNDDIKICGRVEREDYYDLVNLWQTLSNNAKKMRW